MTYEEAGERFGLSPEAIRKRSRRMKWEVEPANTPHGKARILVPDDAALPPQRPPGRPDDFPTGDRIGHIRTDDLAKRLLDRIESLEVTLEAERQGRVADLQAWVAERIALADRHVTVLGELRERAGRSEAERDAAVREVAAIMEQLAEERAARLAERDIAQQNLKRAEQEVARLRAAVARELDQVDQERVGRQTAEEKAHELTHLLGQAEGVAAGLREGLKAAEVARQEVEVRTLTSELERDGLRAAAEREHVARQEAEERVAQLATEVEEARQSGTDRAELEAAQARAEDAEAYAAQAKRQAEEAERRAKVATERLDRIQLARIAEAQATAAAPAIQEAVHVPLWKRLFGLKKKR